MSLQSRLSSLQQRHEALETQLASEGARPKPDRSVLEQCKREKLRLKDEIERVRRTLTQH